MSLTKMEIRNDKECYVQLWRKLERTRQMLGSQYKRFCIRNILKAWFGMQATDDCLGSVPQCGGKREPGVRQ